MVDIFFASLAAYGLSAAFFPLIFRSGLGVVNFFILCRTWDTRNEKDVISHPPTGYIKGKKTLETFDI